MKTRGEYDQLLMPFIREMGIPAFQGTLKSRYQKDRASRLELSELEDLLQYLETNFGGLSGSSQ